MSIQTSPSSHPRYETMIRALKQAHYRLTPQRMAVCRFLAETHTHPTPSEIYHAVKQEFPTISRATVYNTVTVLKNLGQIVELPSTDGTGLRYETDLSPHINLTCVQCGKIYDIPLDDPSCIEHQIEAHTDFQLHRFHVEGYGLCPQCQSQMPAQEEKDQAHHA